jgi:hypothetical protein
LAAQPVYSRKLTTCCNAQVGSLGPKAFTKLVELAECDPLLNIGQKEGAKALAAARD